MEWRSVRRKGRDGLDRRGSEGCADLSLLLSFWLGLSFPKNWFISFLIADCVGHKSESSFLAFLLFSGRVSGLRRVGFFLAFRLACQGTLFFCISLSLSLYFSLLSLYFFVVLALSQIFVVNTKLVLS